MKNSILYLIPPNDIIIEMGKWNMPPLSVGLLQSFLIKKGYNIKAYDLTAYVSKKEGRKAIKEWISVLDRDFIFRNLSDSTNYKEIEALFGKYLDELNIPDYDFIALSAGANCQIFEINAAFLIGKLIKLKYGKTVILGGINIEYLSCFRDTYKDLWPLVLQQFKYIISGPGENSLAALLESFENGNEDEVFPLLKGAIYLKDGKIHSNPVDQATLSKPDFSNFDLDFYTTCIEKNNIEKNCSHFFKYPYPFSIFQSIVNRGTLPENEKEEVVFIPYIFNYHCPYRCAFCEESSEIKNLPLSNDAQTVYNDLESLSKEYNTKYFYFLDNMFNYNVTFVNELCRKIIDNKLEIYWSDCAHVGTLTKDLLGLMYKAGCRKLIIGVESVSEKLLKLIGKNIHKEKIEEVFKWCSEIGIWVDLEVIIGFPYEQEEDFMVTYEFINNNRQLVNNFQLNKYFVQPHSLFGRLSQKYNIEIIDLEDYTSLMQKRYSTFKHDYLMKMNNNDMLIKSFNEIKGRPFKEVMKDTENKYTRIFKLLTSLPIYQKYLSAFFTNSKYISMIKKD